MAINVSFNATDRIIDLIKPPTVPAGSSIGLVTLNLQNEIYNEMVDDWRTIQALRRHRPPFLTAESANGDIPGGRKEPTFFRFRNDQGWRIRPFDSDHQITILGTLVPVDTSQPVYMPRPGRTILIFPDGSQVAGLDQSSVAEAVATSTATQAADISMIKRVVRGDEEIDPVTGKSFIRDEDTKEVLVEKDGVPADAQAVHLQRAVP